MKDPSRHKAGYVNILGIPNVGKSTIMNALVGEKLSIVTSKAQTTRHRIHGIVNGENFQIIYSDTPGILNPAYKLQENMVRAAKSALSDADIILYVTEPGIKPDPENEIIRKIRHTDIPVFLVINKTDLAAKETVREREAGWQKILPSVFIISVSAKKGRNMNRLLNKILKYLPYSPPYFPKDALTDKSERFFTGEILREKILLNYKQEIPYSVEIEIEEFKESDKIIKIRAVIFVERETQKGIIIGKKGESLKKTGTEARKEMEEFFVKKVFLELFVKVRKDWRNNERILKGFGYR